MYLREICNENFALVQADWTVGMGRQFVERLHPSHVILRRVLPSNQYYLFGHYDFLILLNSRRDETVISDAIDMRKEQATPTRDAYSDLAEAPTRTVVIQEGYVVGFCDKTVPPEAAAAAVGTNVYYGGSKLPPKVKRTPDETIPSRGPGAASHDAQREIHTIEAGGIGPATKVAPQPVPRFLVADFPERVPLGETHSLLVSLSVEAGSGTGLPIVLPSRAMIDVIVQPKLGFTLDGIGEGSLVVDDPARSSFQFKLKATELGVGRITLFVFHQQRLQGFMTLTPTVIEATKPIGMRREQRKQFESSVRVIQPDLSLLIFAENTTTLSFRLSALDSNLDFHLKPFGPVHLQLDPLTYVQNLFREIEELPLRTPEDRSFAENRIAAKGCMLFENAIPVDLQVALWSLKDQIKMVQIDSQEPWIPWEICKLVGKENGIVVPGPFFGEAFAIARWRMGLGMKPTLRLKNIALVLPSNSNLQSAAEEGAYIQSLANEGRNVTRVPAKYLDVIAQMTKGEYDGWHFTGHGDFTAPDPNRSVVVLEDRQLTPEDISGVVKNVGNPKPLVFLNACRTGQNALSLTKIGGWASQFLEAGAGAFLGAYWTVHDQAAQKFAECFYDGLLLGDMNIAKAVQQARLAIKQCGDPTWLAYTVFADPTATSQKP